MAILSPLPAIMIGGPPHSGKSVLAYNLTRQLRTLQVDHYLLRACPDGEGDWSNEADLQTVRTIRYKGQFTAGFVTNVLWALNHRMLPLLVDVGGRPQPEQEAILAACSHAILIAQNETQLAEWRQLANRLQLPIVAELLSSLTESDQVNTEYPLFQARITGLERGAQITGPVLSQLTALVRALLATKPRALRDFHLAHAPAEITVDIERLAHTLQTDPPGRWQPKDLPALLAYLPQNEPLAIYGRSTNWIYSALACYTASTVFWQFDARLGWVEPSDVRITTGDIPFRTDDPLSIARHLHDDYTVLEIKLTDPHLDYTALQTVMLPTLPAAKGLVISGRLPLWLLTSVVRAYVDRPWLAVYQPPLQGAVIVYSTQAGMPVGNVIALNLPATANKSEASW